MTVLRFEADQTSPTRGTLTLIRQAFEAAGVEFTPDRGLRLRDQPSAEETILSTKPPAGPA